MRAWLPCQADPCTPSTAARSRWYEFVWYGASLMLMISARRVRVLPPGLHPCCTTCWGVVRGGQCTVAAAQHSAAGASCHVIDGVMAAGSRVGAGCECDGGDCLVLREHLHFFLSSFTIHARSVV
uniref:Uncharacterized protein n=1 Tax=Chlamydomonas leiostraca TaxID=1034604 RepID=A0A7S0RAN8_9CHLO